MITAFGIRFVAGISQNQHQQQKKNRIENVFHKLRFLKKDLDAQIYAVNFDHLNILKFLTHQKFDNNCRYLYYTGSCGIKILRH
jgi:hypothetical protein